MLMLSPGLVRFQHSGQYPTAGLLPGQTLGDRECSRLTRGHWYCRPRRPLEQSPLNLGDGQIST